MHIIETAIRANIPILVVGEPGTGKTSSIEALCRRNGWPYEVIIAGIREPCDFLGLAVARNDRTEWLPPDWAISLSARAQKHGCGVLVLDEISCAPPTVQAALLRVIQERVVGSHRLAPEIAIIAIANPAEQAAGGWDLAAAMANRFIHYRWRLDYEKWCEGMICGWGNSKRVTSAHALVASFIHHKPGLLLQVPNDPHSQSQAWPSPRTWEAAACLINVCTSDETIADIVASSVGPGPALEYCSWAKQRDLPDPVKLLAGEGELPSRGDRLYSALASTIAVVAQAPEERWILGWRVLNRVSKKQLDIAAAAARALVHIRPAGAEAPKEAERFYPLVYPKGD